MSNIGLSGLQMAKSGLETSGHNIANAETTGYKEFRNILSDSYAQTSQNNVEMSGVSVDAKEQLFTQGSLKLTGNSFDLAVEGKGFFTLRDNGQELYSRSGYFRLDKDGFVVNQAGYRVQGFQPLDSGEISKGAKGDLKGGPSLIKGKQTSEIKADINLNAGDSDNWTTAFNIYDSLGEQHSLAVKFDRGAHTNGVTEWKASYLFNDQAPSLPPLKDTLKFNNKGELLDSTNNPTSSAELRPKLDLGGNTPEEVTLNLSLTQYATAYSINDIENNGSESGQLKKVTIGDDGLLESIYSNGARKASGQVMLAIFPSDVGLTVAGKNCWSKSGISGDPIFHISGKGGAGTVRSGALEQSNVDVTEELLNLVVEQRNYQLNARTIKVEDTMSQTLLNQF